jgi:hypothetical protein
MTIAERTLSACGSELARDSQATGREQARSHK